MIAAGDLPHRSRWIVALRAVEAARVRELASALRARHRIAYRRNPDCGLTMLQLREPNLGQRFLLGELPLACAEVAIAGPDGEELIGAASALGDDPDLATALAICDGVLAARLDGHLEVAALLREGLIRLEAERRVRAGLLHRTTVQFHRLEEAADDDD